MKAKINRKKIIGNLVEIPEGASVKFWQKEMVFLKRLEKKYGIDFLAQLQEEKKLPTLAFLFADWKSKLLDVEHKEFYYTRLHKEDLSQQEKIGKDAEVKTKKTIKEFLS
jgi:hypothetical protein